MLDIRAEGPGRIALVGHSSLHGIEVLVEALRELLPAPGVIVIDTSGLEDLDTASLQVLLAFAKQRPGGVKLTGWPPTLAARLNQAGFHALT